MPETLYAWGLECATLSALRIFRFTVLDSVYASQLSKDQSLLFTANRGPNHITVYDYPLNQVYCR